MNIQSGFYYHIKDIFFEEIQDNMLMTNKENNNYRPHYLALQDTKFSQIFWMVPVSSRFIKYKKIHDDQIKKYKKCTKIVLGKCGGWNAAFLIQNAFPITADYFDHIHTSKGFPLTLHESTAKSITRNLRNNLRLHERGIKLFYADIDRIYHLMVQKIEIPNNNNLHQ
ncbi:MAG: type III toxin-antitoxin system CptIN family toxin [Lachnospiraceae bacterium]